MRIILGSSVFVALFWGVITVFPQSGSVPATSNQSEKRNRREEKKPTPTPSIVNDEKPANDSEKDDTPIRIETRLVTIPVRIVDKDGRFVSGLSKENFKLFDDGIEQEISHFSNETLPFNVVLILDMSYSGKFKAAEIQSAAIGFLDQMRPEDMVMVVSFDEHVKVRTEFTNDRKELYRAIRKADIGSGTSVYDAMDFVLKEVGKSNSRRTAVVLFSDGVDTTSRKALSTTNLHDALEANAIIYPIEYDTFADVQRQMNQKVRLPQPPKNPVPSTTPQNSPFPFPLPQTGIGKPDEKGTTAEEYQRASEYLNELALRTGGRLYPASSIGNLSDAFSKIASELREFYSLGYYPAATTSVGNKHKIKVRVDRPGLKVKARETYVVGNSADDSK